MEADKNRLEMFDSMFWPSSIIKNNQMNNCCDRTYCDYQGSDIQF